MKKVRWGILSTARIGVEKVIPAMQKSQYCDVAAIASQHMDKAVAAAQKLGILRAHGSYEDLLSDPGIDAVYIPLPNHLHVPWSIRALDAGKHVLCEKPMALVSAEAQKLVDAAGKKPELKVMEAFMFRHHPQWQAARQWVADGKIGDLKAIQSFFSYYNVDPENIRNRADSGGGGLMDIGCYCISLSRFIFGREPGQVCARMQYDTAFKTDCLTSGIMDFGDGVSTFTCSTQLTPFQRVNIFGTQGRIEIEIPFNAPFDKPCRMWHQQGTRVEEILFDACNQYTIQADLFSLAILNHTQVPTPLDDAVANMRVLEQMVQSAQQGTWV